MEMEASTFETAIYYILKNTCFFNYVRSLKDFDLSAAGLQCFVQPKILEKMILKNPSQWIWTHDRWK